MHVFLHYLGLSAPLFAIVMLGYGVARLPRWRREWSERAAKLVFAVPLPALLFHMMSDRDRSAVVDARLLIAFFGSCLIVFVIGRIIGRQVFRFDGVAGSVFALGGVFSNNVLLGVPLARASLGPQALPPVALVLLFNAITLWTLVTLSVEWARHGSLSLSGVRDMLLAVLSNPIIIGILGGTAFRASRLTMPPALDVLLEAIGRLAGPAALLVLGMGISRYGVRDGWRPSLAICTLKLVVQPLVVWGLALVLGLPPLERQVVVLLASLSVGVNVYLMSAQFGVLAGPVASSLVLSTLLASITTPLLLTAVTAAH